MTKSLNAYAATAKAIAAMLLVETVRLFSDSYAITAIATKHAIILMGAALVRIMKGLLALMQKKNESTPETTDNTIEVFAKLCALS